MMFISNRIKITEVTEMRVIIKLGQKKDLKTIIFLNILRDSKEIVNIMRKLMEDIKIEILEIKNTISDSRDKNTISEI